MLLNSALRIKLNRMKYEECPNDIKNTLIFIKKLSHKDLEELITREECMDIVANSIKYSVFTMLNGDIDERKEENENSEA